MTARLHTGLVVAVLLIVGALLGSVLLEWGNRRQQAASNVPAAGDARRPLIGERVSLEVLNGAGDQGAAARFVDRLRDMGFDVKTFGNARDFETARTELLDRSGRAGAVAAIADSLGGIPVRDAPAPELYLDATLLLGADWREVLNRLER